MFNHFRNLLFVLLFVGIFTACSTSENTTADKTNNEVSSIYPEWYSQTDFTSDSVSFNGFATAISSDSVIAIANAELQARVNLERAIAEKMENVREALEDNGNSIANNTDFILTLRNAHQSVQEAASEAGGEARPKANYYTGYAKVSISKNELISLLESGFRGKTSYWDAISSSVIFTQEME